MFMPLAFSWQIKQVFPMPVLEFSTIIDSRAIAEPLQIAIALQMINKVEKYGGVIVSPFGSMPKGQTIFFTVLFKSDNDLETFLDTLGAERIG